MHRKITKESFIAWATQLPEDKEFTYVDPTGCVIATYLKHLFPEDEDRIYVNGGAFLINNKTGWNPFTGWLANLGKFLLHECEWDIPASKVKEFAARLAGNGQLLAK
jgi:hypothetical protein